MVAWGCRGAGGDVLQWMGAWLSCAQTETLRLTHLHAGPVCCVGEASTQPLEKGTASSTAPQASWGERVNADGPCSPPGSRCDLLLAQPGGQGVGQQLGDSQLAGWGCSTKPLSEPHNAGGRHLSASSVPGSVLSPLIWTHLIPRGTLRGRYYYHQAANRETGARSA